MPDSILAPTMRLQHLGNLCEICCEYKENNEKELMFYKMVYLYIEIREKRNPYSKNLFICKSSTKKNELHLIHSFTHSIDIRIIE